MTHTAELSPYQFGKLVHTWRNEHNFTAQISPKQAYEFKRWTEKNGFYVTAAVQANGMYKVNILNEKKYTFFALSKL